MCGRYTLFTPADLSKRFGLVNHLDLAPTYNASPGTDLPVIFRSQNSNLVQLMHWGLIPFWAKDRGIGNNMINARAESVTLKPAFRSAFKNNRCLIPASGFYEWDEKHQPYYFHRSSDLFAFAGIYDIWTDTFGRETYSFAIITTQPTVQMCSIHDRSPVIINQGAESDWLFASQSSATLTRLLRPFASPLDVYPVSPSINRPKKDSPDLIQPFNV